MRLNERTYRQSLSAILYEHDPVFGSAIAVTKFEGEPLGGGGKYMEGLESVQIFD